MHDSDAPRSPRNDLLVHDAQRRVAEGTKEQDRLFLNQRDEVKPHERMRHEVRGAKHPEKPKDAGLRQGVQSAKPVTFDTSPYDAAHHILYHDEINSKEDLK